MNVDIATVISAAAGLIGATLIPTVAWLLKRAVAQGEEIAVMKRDRGFIDSAIALTTQQGERLAVLEQNHASLQASLDRQLADLRANVDAGRKEQRDSLAELRKELKEHMANEPEHVRRALREVLRENGPAAARPA